MRFLHTPLSRIALALLAVAFVFLGFQAAQSQSPAPATRGPYMLAAGDKMMVWRIDQATGKVSYCMRDSISSDPAYVTRRGPYCSAWSE